MSNSIAAMQFIDKLVYLLEVLTNTGSKKLVFFKRPLFGGTVAKILLSPLNVSLKKRISPQQ